MANRLQFRRGVQAPPATLVAEPGEPLFDTENGRLYVSDGTIHHDVVLEGLRDIADTYVAGREYQVNQYIQHEGEVYRASATITNNYPAPGGTNADLWVRVSWTERDIQAISNRQTLIDTTSVHLNVNHGSFTDYDLALESFITVEGEENPVAASYDAATDVFEISIRFSNDADSPANAALFSNNHSLIALAYSTNEPADTNNGRIFSVFEAVDRTGGSQSTQYVELRAFPWPQLRQFITAGSAASPFRETSAGSGIYTLTAADYDAYRNNDGDPVSLRQFLPRSGGHLLSYNAAASVATGTPVVETITEDVPTAETHMLSNAAEFGAPVLLRHSTAFNWTQQVPIQPYNGVLNNRVKGGSGTSQTTFANQDVGIFNLGVLPDTEIDNYPAAVSTPSGPKVQSILDPRLVNHALEVRADELAPIFTDTFVPFIPEDQDIWESAFETGHRFVSLQVLKQHFKIGDRVQLPFAPTSHVPQPQAPGSTGVYVKNILEVNTQLANRISAGSTIPMIQFGGHIVPTAITDTGVGLMAATIRRREVPGDTRTTVPANQNVSVEFQGPAHAQAFYNAILAQQDTNGLLTGIAFMQPDGNFAAIIGTSTGGDQTFQSHYVAGENVVNFHSREARVSTNGPYGPDMRIVSRDAGEVNRDVVLTTGTEINSRQLHASHMYATSNQVTGAGFNLESFTPQARQNYFAHFEGFLRGPDYVEDADAAHTNRLLRPLAERVTNPIRIIEPGYRVFDGLSWR